MNKNLSWKLLLPVGILLWIFGGAVGVILGVFITAVGIVRLITHIVRGNKNKSTQN